MKHINIPIFIPHLGCPNDCVFCNQKHISGTTCFVRENVISLIDNALSTIKEKDTSTPYEVEIAFFGGSFTGIDRDDMLYLLKTAHSYIESGDIASIRLSTRPDYIDDEILTILKSYGVKNIELGLQSMDDTVLKASKRGHTSECAIEACKLIKQYGFNLIGQMMIGLPESTLENELYTAHIISSLCDGARVYPTVVLRDTELCRMTISKNYTPLTLDASIMRTGEVLKVFASKGTPVIRIGLQSGEELSNPDIVYGGDYHPAMGELAESYLYYSEITERLSKSKESYAGKNLIIYCSPKSTSKVVGHKKINKTKLINNLNLKSVKVVEKYDIIGYNIELDIL